MVKIEKTDMEIRVWQPKPLGFAMQERWCSYCGIKAGKVTESKIVRTVNPDPLFVLMAYMCSSCKEKQQLYLEKKTGWSRGDIVRLRDFSDTSPVKINEMYNEEYFVGEDGYCRPFSHIDKTFGCQKTLF